MANEISNTPQSDDELKGKTPPIESTYLKTSPGEYPFGKEWSFIWQRFLRVQ